MVEVYDKHLSSCGHVVEKGRNSFLIAFSDNCGSSMRDQNLTNEDSAIWNLKPINELFCYSPLVYLYILNGSFIHALFRNIGSHSHVSFQMLTHFVTRLRKKNHAHYHHSLIRKVSTEKLSSSWGWQFFSTPGFSLESPNFIISNTTASCFHERLCSFLRKHLPNTQMLWKTTTYLLVIPQVEMMLH